MHVDSVDDGAAGTVQLLDGGIGHRRAIGIGPRSGDHVRGGDRGARGGIHLARMMQLDDLDGFEERGGLRREVHQQHCGDGEVGRDEYVDTRLGGQPAAHLVIFGGAEAGGTDDSIDAMIDAPFDVVHHGIGVSEIDHDLRFFDLGAIIAGIDARHQLQVSGLVDRLADLPPHAPLGSENRHLDHLLLTSRVRMSPD